MNTALLTTLVLGLAIGVKHALDADHVVAVSTIVSQYRNPLKATLVGIFWGIGHTTTLSLVGMAGIVFKLVIPNQLALSMELLVGVVLLALGILILWQYRSIKKHTYVHDHGNELYTHEHIHLRNRGEDDIQHHPLRQHRSRLLGMIHGLAGSAALMLLVLSTIQSPTEGAVYILVFGVDSILGMMVISTLIGLAFALSAQRFVSTNQTIRSLAGASSVALGFFVIIDIGFIKGLFHWFG